VVDIRNNIITYLGYFGSGLSIVFVWLCIEDSTVPDIAMLPVRDTAIATQKSYREFKQCSCSVPLDLPNTVLFMCDQVANIRPRHTSVVVTTLTGNPEEKPHSYKWVLISPYPEKERKKLQRTNSPKSPRTSINS
jgi:hypothetical protein